MSLPRHLKMIAALVLLCSAAEAPASGPVRDRIYNPPSVTLSAESLSEGVELFPVVTSDNLRLNGLLVEPKGKALLLVLHGSGASAADVGKWLQPLADAGYGLLLAEYRGFSGNPGSPSEAGLTEDARAFLRAARSRFPTIPIVVVGHSLGGGVAFDLALAEQVETLVTIGTFPKLTAVAPPLARPFITDRFDNAAKLRVLRPETTFLLMHGTADEVIPAFFGNRLHNEAVRLKRSGASFIMRDQKHRPDAGLLAAVLDYALSSDEKDRPPFPTERSSGPFFADGSHRSASADEGGAPVAERPAIFMLLVRRAR